MIIETVGEYKYVPVSTYTQESASVCKLCIYERECSVYKWTPNSMDHPKCTKEERNTDYYSTLLWWVTV